MTSKTLILLCFILISMSIFIGCKKENNFLLSPARKLSGTWKATIPVTFYATSDDCNGTLQDVATTKRTITWKITKKSKNEVDIEWTEDSRSAAQVLINCLYTPDVSPKFLLGTISSSHLTINESSTGFGSQTYTGEFNFTTDLIGGTYEELFCGLYCSGVRTDNNTLKLIRQ